MPKLTITASNRDRLSKDSKASKLFIDSIQWQTADDFELLIADGGSQNYEETKDWLENYGGRIPMRIVRHDIGEAFLRAFLNNLGVRNGEGEFVMTTDVDMMFGPQFVETLQAKMGKGFLVESRTMYWKGPIVNKIYKGIVKPQEDLEACKVGRIKKRTTAGGCQCMHKDDWAKIRGFDEQYVGWGSEDYDLLTRAKKAGIKVKWMGESKEAIMLFHQPHPRNVKRDLEHQEHNKRRLDNITHFSVNPDGWGAIKD